MTIKEKRY